MFKKLKFLMLLAVFGLVVSVNAQWPSPPLPSSGSWSATTINTSTAESYRTVNLTGNVTVDGTITIDRVTLTINSNGASRVISRGSASSCFFKITNGGRLVINGQSGTETITLDGGAKWRRATTSDGDIYGYIQDCFDGGGSSGESYPGVRYAVFDSSNGKSSDMALIYSANSSFSLKYVVLENNYATDKKGGAIRCCGQRNGQITVENTIIRNCQNMKGGGGAVFFDNDDNSTYDSGRKATFTDCEIYGCADYAETSAAGGAGGGGIRTAGKAYTALTMTRCNIHHCYSSRKGGGILWNVGERNRESYTMQLENCTFSYNVSKFSGGGVSNEGKMAIRGCSFRHNKALGIPPSDVPNRIEGYGGGLYSQTYTYATSDFTSELSVDESTVIESNEAIYGGGIAFMLKSVSDLGNHNYTMDFVIDGAKIYGNKATINGGAIYIEKPAGVGENYKGSFVMNSGYIYGNTTPGNGGAVYTEGGISDIINGGFIGQNEIGNPVANTAGESGGAIYANGGSVTVNNGNVKNNNAMVYGGGIYSSDEITLSGTTSIMNNTAGRSGGGVYVDGSIKLGEGSLTVMENHAQDHTVKSNIYLPDGKILIVNSTEFNPQYVGIYAENDGDCFPVIGYESPATTNTLQSIYNSLLSGTCNVFDDKQTYSLAYKYWEGTSLSEDYIYFIKTPWSPLQRSITANDNLKLIAGSSDTYEVNDVKSLTAFLWHVNGISTFSLDEAFSTQHPGAKAKMTADIPMVGYYWVPIGTSAEPFTGTFDGDGHTISDLTMVAANSSTEYGMFGHVSSGADIKNVMLRDCLFTGTNDYVGSLVYKMHGGTLSNCQAHGIVNTALSTCTAGGLVGYANGGEIHSCFSNVELGGYNMGGLVGELASGASLKNSLANAKFQYAGNDASKYIGGLAAINNGTIANCYVREQEGGSHGSATYGTLVGSNSDSGTVSHCFCKAETTPGNNVGSDSDCGTYSAVFDEGSYHKYRSHDCKASTTGNPLECELNAWVDAQTDAAKYAKWNRPTTKDINGDYPLLKMTGSNAAAETSGILHYGTVNTLLAEEGNGAVWFYGAEDSFNPYSGNKLYIDEDAALKQAPSKAGSINATVGITLDNSAGTEGANPTQGGTDAIDWHFFSTSLSNAPLGIAYVNSDGDEDETPYGMYATDLPQYRHTGEGYFPMGLNDYYNEWDFYAYHEPEYQWVNYKRNSASHWNVDTGIRFEYPNEAVLVPGKGYMVALADPDGTLLQCTGKLNDGEITLPLTCDGPHRKGFNLLGNPYQSYLDFEKFAKGNSQTIWNTTIPSDYSREDPDLTRPGYIIMDEDQKGYIFYAYGASANGYTAPRYLHPHQGFMVVTQNAGEAEFNAVFNNDMREVNANGSTFRSEPQADYPLVDLLCYDEDGNRDLTVVELGRPDKGGMAKVDGLSRGKGIIYTHYGDEDYCIAFTEPGLSSVAVRFQAVEEAAFTMKWVTQNGAFSYLHLIDNKMGTDVDCLATDEYRFTASPDDYVSRFKLVFDYTGVEEDAGTAPAETFAFVAGGEMVVNGSGRLEIVDLSGRVIETVDVSGVQSAVAKPALASGIYLLRLTDGDSVKVQKIVLGE